MVIRTSPVPESSTGVNSWDVADVLLRHKSKDFPSRWKNSKEGLFTCTATERRLLMAVRGARIIPKVVFVVTECHGVHLHQGNACGAAVHSSDLPVIAVAFGVRGVRYAVPALKREV